MVAYVFPGQGSQYKGMGAKLFEEFKDLIDKADEILGYSIKDLCMNDPEKKMANTQYTQPALYVVNALSYLKLVKSNGKSPDYVAGHSLGEYNALLAAGVFDFETGLKLVKKRGELMSQQTDGGMAAVIGLNAEEIEGILKKNKLTTIDVANFNTPFQTVISGPKNDIEKAQSVFEAEGIKMYVPLKVSGAFHSRYMEGSSKQFEEFLNEFDFNLPNIPVISNVTARPYKNKEIKKNMCKQISHSVKWVESIRYLMGKGEIDIIQIGPGQVLSNMVDTIKKEAPPLEVEDDILEFEEKTALDTTLRLFRSFKGEDLGDKDFKRDYNLKYAYVAGTMSNGVASKELVVRLAKAGMLGFLSTAGVEMNKIDNDLTFIEKELGVGTAYGASLMPDQFNPSREEEIVDKYLARGIKIVGVSGYPFITPALVRYRLDGISKDNLGNIVIPNKVFAKVSNIDIAKAFFKPAPDRIIKMLLANNRISKEEADIAKCIPMADDICIESRAGVTAGDGEHDLLPSILRLRDEMMNEYGYVKKIRVGATGAIGTPEAGASAFIQGADFIMTGSINQCTVEAATSAIVKDLLVQTTEQDTVLAPHNDLFELGKQVRVLKKGSLFAPNANKLFEVYQRYNSLEEIDVLTKKIIEEKILKVSFEDILREFREEYPLEFLQKAEKNPKFKMILILKWYFSKSLIYAIEGDIKKVTDYQIYCSSAMGAFNRWVKGTELEDWRTRNVDKIGRMIMDGIPKIFDNMFKFVDEG